MKAPSTRILLDAKQFRMVREVLKHRKIYFMAGSASVYVPSRNEKYILSHNQAGQPIVREWPDLDGVMEWRTPGEAARIELKRSFPDVKKVGWPKKSIFLLDKRWPMFFQGNYRGEGVYIDLVGAYVQIYRRLWLDVCYPCGKGSLHLGDVARNLEGWKLARNSVVGIVRARAGAGYRGNVRYKLSMGNEFLSPHLWATVQGVLNEIADRAIRCGCIYVNTDGYIFPANSDSRGFEHWLLDYGFEFRSLAGDCSIRGWGNYKVGERETKHYTSNRLWATAPFKSVDIPYSDNPERIIKWWMKLHP